MCVILTKYKFQSNLVVSKSLITKSFRISRNILNNEIIF